MSLFLIEMFAERWKGKGNEKSDTQKFWLELLHDMFDIERPSLLIEFEKSVALEHRSYIDAYIPSTRTLIEQKSNGANLDNAVKQSDGQVITPYEQAKRYSDWLPDSQRARWIVVCNFEEFRVYDMEEPKALPEILKLSSLREDWHRLSFLVNEHVRSAKELQEERLSVRAGELVGKLYDSLLERYINPDEKATQRSLNIFCVRVVFLLYAEDAGLFEKGQFHDYLKPREISARDALRKLFEVLSQKPEERDPYLESDVKEFPYVNGGLFADKDIELPQLDGEPLRIILEDMSEGFDWSGISPTIFGAVFESTLNPQTRHSGGMHYTSLENIHKVIDPLFLDGLNAELNAIIFSPKSRSRTQKLRAFQKKLSELKFLDPACGSGNFLTESYLSLRRLENRIIKALAESSYTPPKNESLIKVSISQFYGIEINDFAVSVARTALWIAESQMWNETQRMNEAQRLIPFLGDLLPLKTYNHIVEDNALRMDWKILVPSGNNLYIMGNPPFLGYSVQTKEQKQDMQSVFVDESGKPYSTAGKIDYVAGWYYKASEIIAGTEIRVAFVSTNSITQGEQVTYIFKTLHDRFGIEIDFAHQTFEWNSEATDQAHVHVVVIGFDTVKEAGRLRRLYTPEGLRLVENINFYLVAAPNDFAESTNKAVSESAPVIMGGNRPADGGNLIIESEDYEDFIRREPGVLKYIKRYMMGREFINNLPRYCLWLVGISPKELRSMPLVMERVKACKEDRLKGAADRRKLADTPHLFRETLNPKRYIAIPKVSSENREYIPMGWLDESVIPGDNLFIIPEATLYDFGVLTSRVHMAWMRRVGGRLEMRYRYSRDIVYNTFAWPRPTDEQRRRIESTAQKILDARANHPESSFADLYDDTAMPLDLRKARRENDAAVCEAYGWPDDIREEEIVAGLFRLYHELTA